MNGTEKLVLGTVQFGCQYGINSAGRPNQTMVNEIMKEASIAGITTLDTSSAYGNSEEILGENIPSESRFKIVSKYPKGEISVKVMLEGSLKRLNVKNLYGYLLHHFEVYKNTPSVWNDFEALKAEGKVQKIGFSLYNPEELELLIHNKVKFDLLQIPHNIFDRKFDPYLKDLAENGVEVHVRSTFLQGLFFKDRNNLPEKLLPMRKYLLKLDEYAACLGLTMSELALNYNLQNPYLGGVLIGVDNVEQLKINMASVSDKIVSLDVNVNEQDLLNPVNWN